MQELTLTSGEILGRPDRARSSRRGNKSTRVPEILETAARVFARDGYAAFTTRRVADEVGIRLSTLQHYVATREELLSRTLAGLIERYGEVFRGATAENNEPTEVRLNSLIDASINELTKPAVADFWVEVWAMARHEPFARRLETDAYEQGTGRIRKLIGELNPALSSRECGIRAKSISAQIEGLMLVASREREGPTLTAAMNAARAVCRALIKAPG
jgi:AcrR family transcriptional regulator